MYVARYHLMQGGGDLELAKTYTEKVAGSNAEEVREASDLLKKIKLAIAVKASDARLDEPGTPVGVLGMGSA